MSTINEIAAAAARPSRWAERFARFESLLARVADHLNPILIKEARQALKSRQFTITFILVLAAGWCWSIIGIAWMGPGVYWSADGPEMFFGYFLILAFPLIVIVPYGAFRSLAGEREDRTFELLSITTLRPRQIIGGKLAGAVLQMMVYLSAISPCLAFTYLLRGLDILTITTILLYLFLGSLGLSLACLLLATATHEKYQQQILSVGIVFGLGYAFIGACVLAGEMLQWNAFFDNRDFWIANGAFLTAYASYMVLFYLAASSQLSFVGSNRSTPIRIAALMQQVLFTAWWAWAWLTYEHDPTVLVIYTIGLGLHWYVIGVFMTGEPNQLSPRVKRELPQSFLGRAFLTWFNPGPATGYVFAVANFAAGALLVLMALLPSFPNSRVFGPLKADSVALTAGLGLAYLAFYLGLGRLVLGWLGRYTQLAVAGRLLIHVFLLFIGTVVPLTIQLMALDLRSSGYSTLQATNPFWTIAAVADGSPSYDGYAVAAIMGIAGGIVFLLNLPAVAEEVRQVRVAKPLRVAEEDAEAAALSSPKAIKTNPWDG